MGRKKVKAKTEFFKYMGFESETVTYIKNTHG